MKRERHLHRSMELWKHRENRTVEKLREEGDGGSYVVEEVDFSNNLGQKLMLMARVLVIKTLYLES